jgi:hypothetical protein
MVTYPKFADLIWVSEFKSNLKKILKKASSSYAVIIIWFGVILIWKNAPSMYRFLTVHMTNDSPLKHQCFMKSDWCSSKVIIIVESIVTWNTYMDISAWFWVKCIGEGNWAVSEGLNSLSRLNSLSFNVWARSKTCKWYKKWPPTRICHGRQSCNDIIGTSGYCPATIW